MVKVLRGLILMAFFSHCSAQEETRITLDASKHYQTMEGWEVTARAWEFDKSNNAFNPGWEKYADKLFDRLVNELGINRVRLEIKSGAENPVDYWAKFERGEIGYKEFHRHYYEKINDNDDIRKADQKGFQFSELDYKIEKMVLPLKKRLAANGEKLYINFCYVDFRWSPLQGDLSHALQPDEYAEFILVYFNHMRDKYGLEPDSFEIILEPDNTTRWKGREIGNGLVAAVNLLKKHGFTPKIIAPSTSTLDNVDNYFDSMINVPHVSEYVNTLSYHRYGGSNRLDLVRKIYLKGIASRSQKYKINTAMLEHVGGDVDELLEDLTIANASAWQQYAIAAIRRDNGGVYYMVDEKSSPDNPNIRMAGRTPFLRPYFRYIRLGAVRINAVADNDNQQTVAFINPGEKYAVIVKTDQPSSQKISITGLPEGNYGLSFTGADKQQMDLPGITLSKAQILSTQIPDKGILAVYAK